MGAWSERISVNQRCFPRTTTLAEDIAMLARTSLRKLGIHTEKLEAAGGREAVLPELERAGVEVAYLIHSNIYELDRPEEWAAASERAKASLDDARALGAGCVYITTGPRGRLPWEEAAEAFVTAVRTVVEHAQALGLPLLVETTNPLFADIHILHTLRDTVDVAFRAGLGVCVDVYPTWTEPALHEAIERAGDAIGLVQVSDYIPGTRTTDRGVPGEGVIPLERIFGWILATGYRGIFDLELSGYSGMDDVVAVERANEYVVELLERLAPA